MSMFSRLVGNVFNPGGVAAGEASARLNDQQANLFRSLAEQAGTTFGLGKEEYEASRPLLAQQREQAMITPERIQAARDRATADVEREFSAQGDANTRRMMAMGANPGDPSFQAANAGLGVQRATGKAFAGDAAGRNERMYRTQLAGGVLQRPMQFLTGGMQGMQAAGSGFGSAAQVAQNDPRQGLFGIPGLQFARGGKVIRAPHGGHMAEAPPGAGIGIARDPNPSATVPMVKGSDGSYQSPEARSPEVGGELSGPGTGTSDSIPALLSRDEYINPAFVGAALGQPAQDAIVEVARQAQEGDPEGRADLMRLLKTISSFKSVNMAPKRVAGQAPQAPAMARGGMVQRPPRHSPVRAAGGGLMDAVGTGMRLVRQFNEPDPAEMSGPEMAPVAQAAPRPLEWWEQPEGQPWQSPGAHKSSLRNIGKLAASAMALAAARGGRVDYRIRRGA